MLSILMPAGDGEPEHWHRHFAAGVYWCDSQECLCVDIEQLRAAGCFRPDERVRPRAAGRAAWQACQRIWADIPATLVMVKTARSVRIYSVKEQAGPKGGG